MVARIPEGFFAGLYPKISKQTWMSLNGIAFVVIVGGIDELKSQIVPNCLEYGLADFKYVHISFWMSQSLDGESFFLIVEAPDMFFVFQDGFFEFFWITRA